MVAEIKYSVCPHPFKRPREARRVRDWCGMGKGQVWDGYRTGMGRVRDGMGSSTIGQGCYNKSHGSKNFQLFKKTQKITELHKLSMKIFTFFSKTPTGLFLNISMFTYSNNIQF